MNINKYIKIIKKHIPEINDVQAMEIIERTNYKHDTEKEIIDEIKLEITKYRIEKFKTINKVKKGGK